MYHSVNTKIAYAGELLVVCQKGSILGRLLFLIYINDLFGSSSKVTPVMFADDTNLFISDSTMENLFETINEDLRKLATWFKANKFFLNISEAKYALFHSTRKRKCIPYILPPLHIDNFPITREFVPRSIILISWAQTSVRVLEYFIELAVY